MCLTIFILGQECLKHDLYLRDDVFLVHSSQGDTRIRFGENKIWRFVIAALPTDGR